jgi:hypothetical protein
LKPLLFLALFVTFGLWAMGQKVYPAQDTSHPSLPGSGEYLRDSLRHLWRKDSVLKKMPATLLQAPGAQLQSLNPVNVVGTQYKADLSSVKSSLNQLNPLNKHLTAIRVSNVALVVSADYINGPADSLAYGTTDYNSINTQVSGTLTLFNIPLNLAYQYQTLQGGGIQQSYTGTAISFNKQAFTSYLATQLKGKFNPEAYLPQQYLSIDKMKESAMGDMQQDIGKVQQQYGSALGPSTGLAGLSDWKTVNETDPATLAAHDRSGQRAQSRQRQPGPALSDAGQDQ